MIGAGSIIPASRVADVSACKPEPGDEALVVTDNGNFWGRTLEDGSFVIERAA